MASRDWRVSRTCVLGLDLGGFNLKGGIISPQGERLYVEQVPSGLHTDPGGLLDRLVALTERLQRQARAKNLYPAGLGLSSTLDVDPDRGYFLPVHYDHLKIWEGVPIAEQLRARCDLPTLVENDGPAAAWGEYCAGAGLRQHSLLMVTLGSGVGGGAVLEGQRLRETLGSAAYFGHMTIHFEGPPCPCGRRGCWELYASATALEGRAAQVRRSIKETILSAAPSSDEIVRAARQGDALALQLLEEHGRYLGIGLVNLANLFNPGLIVIGGGLSLAGDVLLEPARRVLSAERLPMRGDLRVVPAKHPLDAGWIGAALLAWEKFGVDGVDA